MGNHEHKTASQGVDRMAVRLTIQDISMKASGDELKGGVNGDTLVVINSGR